MKSLLFALTLAAAAPFALAGPNPVFECGFETPKVTHRTPRSEGGDVAKEGENSLWRVFQDTPAQASQSLGGSVVGGLTNEMFHSGAQSLFIQADNLTAPHLGVKLVSQQIKITPGQVYSVGIWGRNDIRNPMTAESQSLYLKMKADFFAQDGTQTGETEYLVVPLPGTLGHKPLFVDTQWRRLAKSVTAPSDAQSMVVTWKWDSSPVTKPANGVMYFDDATVIAELPPTPRPEATPEPSPAK
jgi:hypothetical protein